MKLDMGFLGYIIGAIVGFMIGRDADKHKCFRRRKAYGNKQNPDLCPDFVVRVTAYFVSLSPKFRQLVVDRFLEEN